MNRPGGRPLAMNTITRDDLHARLRDAKLVLLETLPEAHYTGGHLPGARWFSTDRARELASAAAANRDVPIVVYCASDRCQWSHQVARVLADVGYTDVRVYLGGKADWLAAGLPIEP
jgi:rhodanese-related sulfurtransferase